MAISSTMNRSVLATLTTKFLGVASSAPAVPYGGTGGIGAPRLQKLLCSDAYRLRVDSVKSFSMDVFLMDDQSVLVAGQDMLTGNAMHLLVQGRMSENGGVEALITDKAGGDNGLLLIIESAESVAESAASSANLVFANVVGGVVSDNERLEFLGVERLSLDMQALSFRMCFAQVHILEKQEDSSKVSDGKVRKQMTGVPVHPGQSTHVHGGYVASTSSRTAHMDSDGANRERPSTTAAATHVDAMGGEKTTRRPAIATPGLGHMDF